MANRQQKLRGIGMSNGDRYVQLEHYMLKSKAWQALNPQAWKLYIAVCLRHNGINNGTISYAVREAEAISLTRSTAKRAFDELEVRGFLALTRDSSFSQKARMARLWRITAYPTEGRDATQDFMRWQPSDPVKLKHSPTRGTDSPTRGTVSAETHN